MHDASLALPDRQPADQRADPGRDAGRREEVGPRDVGHNGQGPAHRAGGEHGGAEHTGQDRTEHQHAAHEPVAPKSIGYNPGTNGKNRADDQDDTSQAAAPAGRWPKH